MDYLMVLVAGSEDIKRVTVDRVQVRRLIRMTIDKDSKHKTSKFLAKKMVREMDTGGVVTLNNPANGSTLLAARVDKQNMLNNLLEDLQGTMSANVH